MYQEVDRIVSRFIWEGKKLRVKYKTLQIPNFKNYFQAAQLIPLFDLCDPRYVAGWEEIENVTCDAVPIPALIGNAIHKKGFKLNYPWSEAMLNIGCKLIRKYKDPFLPITWMEYDPKFVPNVTDGKTNG